MYPRYWQKAIFHGFRLLFLFAQMESNPPTQNLCFNLYIYYND